MRDVRKYMHVSYILELYWFMKAYILLYITFPILNRIRVRFGKVGGVIYIIMLLVSNVLFDGNVIIDFMNILLKDYFFVAGTYLLYQCLIVYFDNISMKR